MKIITLISAFLSFLTNQNTYVTNDISINLKENNLYKDENYIYKGKNPNNYIIFNNEIYRIISFEKDGKIKIIKNDSIGNFPFDIENSNNWEKSSLNNYLNNIYYYKINQKSRNLIQKHKWEETNNLYYIGLISISDYIKSNNNSLCQTIYSNWENFNKCKEDNYLNSLNFNNKNNYAWTISKDVNNIYHFGNMYFGDSMPSYNDFAVFPVLYLKGNVSLKGKGTIEMPYQII